MFISQHHIENATKTLEGVNPFWGTTFLVFKQAKLPLGKAAKFYANQKYYDFLQHYYQPDKRSAWFYRAFRKLDKSKYWINPKYAWANGHRTQSFGPVFLHKKNSRQWGWHENYVIRLKGKLQRNQPLPTFALAIWLYRDQEWTKATTPQDIVNQFFEQFNITALEKNELFEITAPARSDLEDWLVHAPFSWSRLAETLNIPPAPDVPHDEGGTLSALSIAGVGPVRNLALDLANRVNLFTGDNGLGKSFILESAWWALSGQWAGFPAYPRADAKRDEPKISFQIVGASGRSNSAKSSYNWEKQAWSSLEKQPTVSSLLIYARVDGAFAVWDPAKDHWGSTENVVGNKPLVFSRDEVWNGVQDSLGGKTSFLSNGLIADWILWQNSPEKEQFDILKRVLERLSPPDQGSGDLGRLEPGKPIRIPRDSRWMPTIKHAYSEIPLVHASAGIRRIVALAYLIVWAWTEHKAQSTLIRKKPQQRMVILVDEIEAHLHPKWQRRILPALLDVQNDLAAELQMQLLVASHSPLVMASIEPFFETKRDKIFHLDLVSHDLFKMEVELQELEFVLHGTSDSWLRSDIFNLSHTRSKEAEQALEDAKEL